MDDVFDALEKVLGSVSFTTSTRARLVDDSSGKYVGFNAGLTNNYTTSRTPSWLNRTCNERPNLVRYAGSVAKLLFPEHYFTNVQFNKNVSAKLHVDENNLGLQCILGCGSYKGPIRTPPTFRMPSAKWTHDQHSTCETSARNM